MSAQNRSNIRLKPNVICKRLYDDDHGLLCSQDIEQIAQRLTYYELRALGDAAPYVFPRALYEYESLSARQQVHHDAFLKGSGPNTWKPVSLDYAPIHVVHDARRQTDFADTEEGSSSEITPETVHDDQSNLETKDSEKGFEEGASEETSLKDDESVDKQLQVVEAPVDRNILVLAPPGTGKTHVLIERLVFLLNSQKFENPADEVLVLSFTRATVSEIRRRLAERLGDGGGDDLRYVGVRTFDSFATRALIDHLGEQEMERRLYAYRSLSSYDRRIRLFTDVISKEDSRVVSGLKYLVVDEIQDLVCERANMVLELMRAILGNNGSVLVLGDPAQGIYDYQAESDQNCPGKVSSQLFLSKVRNLFADSMHEVEFTKFYRYADKTIKEFVKDARQAMGSDGANPDKEELLRLVYGLGSPVDFPELPAHAASEGRIAILVRKNSEADQITHWCETNGLPVHLHRGARGGQWPPCMARVFYGWKQDVMSVNKFDQRWEKYDAGRGGLSAASIKNQLQTMRVLDSNGIDIKRLRYIMATEPAPTGDIPDNCIVVSNVHKAKGLEYDSVLVLEPDTRGMNSAEELRVLYVAATRARKRLHLLQRDRKITRWAPKVGKTSYCKTSNAIFTNGVDDLESDILANGLDSPSGHEKIQSIMWERYLEGGKAFISIKDVGGGDAFALGFATDEGQIEDVCWCSDEFGNALWGQRQYAKPLIGERVGWDVSLQGVVSVAFDPSDDEATDNFGNPGMVLVPVLGPRIVIKQG